MINKKTLKQIKKGNRDALMCAIDDLFEIFNEDRFTLGYNACIEDLVVHSKKLSDRIQEVATSNGLQAKRKGIKYYVLDPDDLAIVISDFFDEIIQK